MLFSAAGRRLDSMSRLNRCKSARAELQIRYSQRDFVSRDLVLDYPPAGRTFRARIATAGYGSRPTRSPTNEFSNYVLLIVRTPFLSPLLRQGETRRLLAAV